MFLYGKYLMKRKQILIHYSAISVVQFMSAVDEYKGH
jgi:hypothetical protein